MKTYKGWLDFRGMSDGEMIRELRRHKEVITLTTLVGRAKDDVQFVANRAGMTATRFNDPKLLEAGLFSECYIFRAK